MESAQGARTDLEHREGVHPKSRGQIAAETGMSVSQQKQAVRVANVPTDEFERLVESDEPPTVTELAQAGIQNRLRHQLGDYLKGRDPEEFNRALHFVGGIGDALRVLTKLDLEAAAFLTTEEHAKAKGLIEQIVASALGANPATVGAVLRDADEDQKKLQASVLAAAEEGRKRRSQEERPSPAHEPAPLVSKAAWLLGVLQQIAEFGDWQAIADWNDLPITARQLREQGRAAHARLGEFLTMCAAVDDGGDRSAARTGVREAFERFWKLYPPSPWKKNQRMKMRAFATFFPGCRSWG